MTSRNTNTVPAPVVDLPDRGTLQTVIGVATPERIKATLYEDYLPRLRGHQALRTYREMGNDATVASILFAIEMLVRSIEWTPERVDDTPAAVAAEELITEEHRAIAGEWGDLISQIVTALQYGFSLFEVTYQVRDDGRIGWAEWGFRPQTTLAKWVWDGPDVVAFRQALDTGGTVDIPLEKALLFRSTTATTAPEGRSVLRPAYRSWFFKKRAEELMMVGLEKDLVGLLVGEIPTAVLAKGSGDPVYDAVKNVVTRTKRHEQAGILWPGDLDENGKPLFNLRELTGGGRAKVDALGVIRMFATDIAATVLAQFTMLGRDAVGSRALSTPQQSLFEAALMGWVRAFQDVVNRQGVDRLLALNGMAPGLVQLKATPIEETDIAGTAAAAKDFAAALAAFDTGDDRDPLFDQMRQMLGFAPAPEGTQQQLVRQDQDEEGLGQNGGQ